MKYWCFHKGQKTGINDAVCITTLSFVEQLGEKGKREKRRRLKEAAKEDSEREKERTKKSKGQNNKSSDIWQ
jgi:hypothetical protein